MLPGEQDGDGWDETEGTQQGLYVTLPAEELTLEGFAEDGRTDTMAPGPLLAMVDHGIEQGFIKPEGRRLFHVAETVDEAVAQLLAAGRDEPPPPTSVGAVAEGS